MPALSPATGKTAFRRGSKTYRMRISLRLSTASGGTWPQFFQVAQPGVVNAVGQRAAQLRPGFDQHADGLADLYRAGPVMLAQIMQPLPDLRRHHQGIGHVSCLSAAASLRWHDITQT